MKALSQTLFTNWHIMRWFRLLVGLYAGYEAIMMHDQMLGFFSAFFLLQAATNTGCCGTQSCATTPVVNKTSESQPIVFEEIKAKQE